MKDYLLKLLENCSDQNFGQEAVEHGILTGAVVLTCNLQADLVTIMGQPGKPETGLYDQLCATYREVTRTNTETLMDVYQSSGLMAELMGVKALDLRAVVTTP